MMSERTDQQSAVTTEEVVKPRDSDVVVTDTPAAPPERPATPPAAADASIDADSAKQATAPEDQQSKPNRRDRRSEKRIRRLSEKLGSAERERVEQEQRIADLERKLEEVARATPKAPEPQLDDYRTPQEYAKALVAWEAKQAPPDPPPTHAKPPPARADEQPPSPVIPKDVVAFKERGTEKLGDEFLEAMEDKDLPINQQMAEFLFDSDVGPELMIHLANNADDARAIYDSGPSRIMKKMAELERQAEAGELDIAVGELDVAPVYDDKPKPKAAPRKTTKAPPPPSTTRDGGNVRTDKQLDEMSMDEYAEMRRNQLSKQPLY